MNKYALLNPNWGGSGDTNIFWAWKSVFWSCSSAIFPFKDVSGVFTLTTSKGTQKIYFNDGNYISETMFMP